MRVGVYRKKALKIMEEAGKQGETTWEMGEGDGEGGGESGGWGPRPFLASQWGRGICLNPPLAINGGNNSQNNNTRAGQHMKSLKKTKIF